MEHIFTPPCPFGKTSLRRRALLGCGHVAALGHEFFSDRLAHLRDQLQKRTAVDVAVDPDDLSHVWVFDPNALRWIRVGNLYPSAAKLGRLDGKRSRRGRRQTKPQPKATVE